MPVCRNPEQIGGGHRGYPLPGHLPPVLPFGRPTGTRGEPGGWRESEIKTFEMTLKDGRITGRVHFERADGKRGYKAAMLGFVNAKEGVVTRFDIVVKGDYWGEGRYSRNSPTGKFPFAVTLRLTDGTEPYDTPPPGSR